MSENVLELEREESASTRWMTRMVPDPTCTNEPIAILRKITSDSFFPNPFSPFGQGHLPLPWPEMSSRTAPGARPPAEGVELPHN